MEHFVVNRLAIACWANWLLENSPALEEIFRPGDLLYIHTTLFVLVSFAIAIWNRDGHKVKNLCSPRWDAEDRKIALRSEWGPVSDPWLRKALSSLEKWNRVCNLNVTNAFAKAFNKGSFIVIPVFKFRKANYPNKWLAETIVQI